MRTRAECSIIRMENWMVIGITLQGNTECWIIGINCLNNTDILFLVSLSHPLHWTILWKVSLSKKKVMSGRDFKKLHASLEHSLYWETLQKTEYLAWFIAPAHFFPLLLLLIFVTRQLLSWQHTTLVGINTLAVGWTHIPFPFQGGFY